MELGSLDRNETANVGAQIKTFFGLVDKVADNDDAEVPLIVCSLFQCHVIGDCCRATLRVKLVCCWRRGMFFNYRRVL